MKVTVTDVMIACVMHIFAKCAVIRVHLKQVLQYIHYNVVTLIIEHFKLHKS